MEKFASLKRESTRAGRALAVLTSFIAAWVPLATALVFIGVATLPPHSVSPGSFLAFNTSFTEVVASMVILSISVSVLAAAVPYYTRLRPLFETAVETAEVKADPGVVRGAIDVSHVSYHYERSDPLVLDDVSFSISPGELVAIVGPSGSGSRRCCGSSWASTNRWWGPSATTSKTCRDSMSVRSAGSAAWWSKGPR